MNYKTKPVSRLTLVFILSIVISGSILTWFSINNISNLKELTEKRINEEQRELADRFGSEVHNILEKSTSSYNNEIAPVDQLKKQLFKTTREYKFFSMSFILDNKGQFLFPYFREEYEEAIKNKPLATFIQAFSEGEKAEFAESNFSKARLKYITCLRYSKNRIDSVKVLNALGRLAVKQDRKNEALQNYGSIVRTCYAATGDDGFPYIYYAIPQLLKVYCPENSNEIMTLTNDCLEKMEAGMVPLNFYTAELLSIIKIWLEDNLLLDNEKFQNISKLVDNIAKQLMFVQKYKNTALLPLSRGDTSNHLRTGNGFEVLAPYSTNGNELLIAKEWSTGYYGFLVNCEMFFQDLIKSVPQNGYEFEYELELSKGYNSMSNQHYLVYSAQASPLFPNRYLQIKLKNENLINELVRKRSWIYGIASVLLIVAMFLGVFLILRDISREKHLARLRADFISNVTHELKTPLTSIHMFTESLLLKRVRSSKQKSEYLSIIIKESERLKRMINNILEFSKMDKGKLNIHWAEANLTDTVKAAIQDLDYWLEKENFKVVTELEEDISTEYDQEKMKQALSNLISNAIKYSGKSKEIKIRTHRNSKGIVVDVEDKGIGIPADKQNRIFEKFYRVDQKENISGTGLGLTVVKEIIEAHGGSITVSSIPGEGSKFSILL